MQRQNGCDVRMTEKQRPSRMTADDLRVTANSFPPEIRNSRSRLTFTLTATMLKHLFGREWVENHVIQDEKNSRPPTFFRLDFSSDEKREIKSFRVVDFAETLFNLQDIPGFYDRLEQMKGAQCESTYAEFDFARFLYIHDVDFEFVKPVGVKGSDYDFLIRYKNGHHACADAKCRLESTDINPETIKSVLEHARKQNLPADKPGIIFVKLPQTWIETAELRASAKKAVKNFLRNTERIVSVILYTSILVVLQKEQKIWNRHAFDESINDRHRFDMSKDYLLFKNYIVPSEWRGMPPKWTRIFSHG